MQQQYSSLSQDELRNLYNSRGAILLLDVPEGLEFGIDNILWKVGQKFKGIKFIPFGAHIISYTLKQQNNQFKINKFIFLDQSKQLQTQILIFKWSNKYSMFLQMKGSEAQGYKEGVKKYHFDSYLGPYPTENLDFWKENTQFISRMVMEKLQPVEKIYKFEEEYNKITHQNAQEEVVIDAQDDDEDEVIEEKPDELMEEEKPNNDNQNNPSTTQNVQKCNKKFQPLSDTIYYSEIPRILTNDPQHISKINLNKTQILIQIIFKQYLLNSGKLPNQSPSQDSKTIMIPQHDNKNKMIYTKQKRGQSLQQTLCLLGQLQYAFIYFLIGEDQESFQHWKKLINLFVFSQDIFQNQQINKLKKDSFNMTLNTDYLEELGLQFIVVFYNQLKQFPVDFFINQLSKNSFIQTCLKRLNEYKNDEEGIISKKVKKRLEKLFKLLSSRFNFQLNNQQGQFDEDAPVIVENDHNYF